MSSVTTLRHPTLADGAAIYELVREGGGLDLNTPYAYLLLADRFAATSIVAETSSGTLAGTVLAFRPPEDPSTLFVWQVGVHPDHRGEGLAARMLHELLRDTAADHLEATVTPSNTASDRLFRGVARDLEVPCEVTAWAAAEDFPEGGHEREDRYRIGPLPTTARD